MFDRDSGLGLEGVVDGGYGDEDVADWVGVGRTRCIAAAVLVDERHRRLRGSRLMENIRHLAAEVGSGGLVLLRVGMIEGELPLGWHIVMCRVLVGCRMWIVGDDGRDPRTEEADCLKGYGYGDRW